MDTRIGQSLLGAAYSAKEDRMARLIWACAIANGAALLAFLNIIGNVDHPDAALRFLTGPLTICCFGLVAGGGAGNLFSQLGERELDIMTDLTIMESVTLAATSSKTSELYQAALILEGRTGKGGGSPPRNLRTAEARLEAAIAAFNLLTAGKRAEKEKLFRRITWRSELSVYCIGFAGVWIAITYFLMDWRIQP